MENPDNQRARHVCLHTFNATRRIDMVPTDWHDANYTTWWWRCKKENMVRPSRRAKPKGCGPTGATGRVRGRDRM